MEVLGKADYHTITVAAVNVENTVDLFESDASPECLRELDEELAMLRLVAENLNRRIMLWKRKTTRKF